MGRVMQKVIPTSIAAIVAVLSAAAVLSWHIWGCVLLGVHWGTGWGVAGFCFPMVTEFLVAWKCLFAWGVWYYLLGFALLPLLAWGGEASEHTNTPIAPMLALVGVIIVGCYLGFTGNWGMPAPDVEGEAIAILNAMDADGDGALSDGRLQEMKSRFQRFDSKVQESVCKATLSYMTYDVMASGDMCEWLERGRHDYRVSSDTLKAAALMPPRIRRMANADDLEKDAQGIARALEHTLGGVNGLTTEDVQFALNRGWENRQGTYSRITGRQLPSRAELIATHLIAMQ
jgi:hypothetical protein